MEHFCRWFGLMLGIPITVLFTSFLASECRWKRPLSRMAWCLMWGEIPE
jgi:hypothetical protein